MRISTMKGLAAGGMLGITVGAGLMMTPQGKKMRRILTKGGAQIARQVVNCWIQ